MILSTLPLIERIVSLYIYIIHVKFFVTSMYNVKVASVGCKLPDVLILPPILIQPPILVLPLTVKSLFIVTLAIATFKNFPR